MKLLIASGGGGHFAAGLAVIEELPKDWEVLVIGRKYAFEADKTPSLESITSAKLGINFKSITTGRLQRNLSPESFNIFLKMPIGFFQAVKIIKDFKPDIILSTGGYVSIPVGVAAKTLGVPIFVHEQTFGGGLANKIVGKFAQKIFISWEESKKYFPAEKVILTGNPIKKFSPSAKASADKQISNEKLPVIYVTGGSGGAHAINVLIEGCLEKLLEKYVVIHQTGAAKLYGDFDRLAQNKESLSTDLQKRYILAKFIDSHDVYAILKKADLVVTRSGINTVTELLYFGKPALFIPLPHGQRGEQLTNAAFVKNLGLSEIANQDELTPDGLYSQIDTMLKSIDLYQKNSEAGKKLVHLDAAQKIISLLKDVNR